MKRITQWTASLKSLLTTKEGSALPLIGAVLGTMITSTAVAVDMGRVQVAQSRMSNALDAAGLAAGSSLNSADLNAEVTKYFNVNFPAANLGATVNHLTMAISQNNSVLTLHADGVVNTTFMRIVGVNQLAISADSQITRANRGLELVMVMDNTGSMNDSVGGGISKMTAAKNAATSLVNILYGSNQTVENLWIGLVPFAQAVNIGTNHSIWTSGTFNWGPTTWGGCVDARETSSRDVTDDPPSVAFFPKYYWPDDSNNDWIRNDGTYRSITATVGPNAYCGRAITPLTATKATVLSGINAMTPNGNTHIVLGAAWGWRLISPRWRNLWGGEMNTNALPLNYNTPLMNKAVIIMTDGDNTIDSSVRGAYWYLHNGRLGTTNQNAAITQLNTRLSTVCTNMKNNGVLIYTIAFGTSIGTTAQNMLRNCATNPDYYFASPSSADLQIAFRQIGDSLANLRISQ